MLIAVPPVCAQPDDSNGFDMGQVYENKQPEAFSDASSEFPVEGQDQRIRNAYPKYQFKNAGASKVIIPELTTGAAEVNLPTNAEPAATTGDAEPTAPNPAGAAAGDASYYQEIISKVKAQGEYKAASEREKSKVSEYKF